jgi:hypothetical protein
LWPRDCGDAYLEKGARFLDLGGDGTDVWWSAGGYGVVHGRLEMRWFLANLKGDTFERYELLAVQWKEDCEVLFE